MMPPVPREQIPTSAAVIPTRILVLDDEPLIRWSICSALAANGFDAVAAADAADARRIAAEWPPPRLVLLDPGACDRSCAEVMVDIQARHADCRFVIMTTARDYPASRIGGADVEVLHKPFDLGQVVRLVRRLAADPAPA